MAIDIHDKRVVRSEQAEVSVAEAKAKLSELLRRVEMTGDRINVTRRGKTVAQIVPVDEQQLPAPEDWLTRGWGLLAEAPEVVDAIDEVYRDRQNHMPRELHFPWDDEE